MKRPDAIAVGLAVGLFTGGIAGCEQVEEQLAQQCRVAKSDYEASLREERTELTEASSGADAGMASGDAGARQRSHFGLTLSDDLVSRLADFAVEPIIQGALALASTVSIEGQSVSLQSEGDVVDLSVTADDACDHCFRLRAKLGGAIVARLPNGATKRASLGGAAGIVAPLIVEKGDRKSTAVKLDLPQATEMAATRVQPELVGIAPEFADALRAPLSRLIENRLVDRLKPVTLVEFDGPSFGIDGFELRPTRLRSDDEQGAVFVGFGTNVAALNEGDVPSVPTVTALGEGQHVALSFHPGLVWRVLSLLIEQGDVARRYTRSGAAAASSGDFHVVLSGFRPGEAPVGSSPGSDASVDTDAMSEGDTGDAGGVSDTGVPAGDRAGAGLDFSLHRFRSGGICFSASARALGSVGVREGDLQVALDDVRFTSETLASRVLPIQEWSRAQFLGETEQIIQTSLNADNLTVPGTTLAVGPVGVDISSEAVVLRGTSELKADGD